MARIDTESRGLGALIYLTYFGGADTDRVEAVAIDAEQNAYVTGGTLSAAGSFPLVNAFDSTQKNGEAFIAKLNADGTSLFYSSFLGGNNGSAPEEVEEGRGIAVDLLGNACVTGRTTAGATFIDDLDTGTDTSFHFGTTFDLPMAGDWDGDGVDGVGVYRRSDQTMHITNDLGVTERAFTFRSDGDLPVAGNWDGQ